MPAFCEIQPGSFRLLAVPPLCTTCTSEGVPICPPIPLGIGTKKMPPPLTVAELTPPVTKKPELAPCAR